MGYKYCILLVFQGVCCAFIILGHGEKSYGGKSHEAKTNVIWIVVDTLRADHLSCYNNIRKTTPNIDEFAQNAFVFLNAYSSAPWTLPSYSSMLTSKHAFHHDYNQPVDVYRAERLDGTLVGYMRNAGYNTVSIQTNTFLQVLDSEFDDVYHLFEVSNSPKLDEMAVGKSIEWLGEEHNIEGCFFCFLGLMGPHWPYFYQNSDFEIFATDALFHSSTRESVSFAQNMIPDLITYDNLPDGLKIIVGEPENHSYYTDSRLYVSAYDADIQQTDSCIGKLFDHLKSKGIYESSLIIVTGDHGESLTEVLPYFSHGQALHNCLIHVPMLIKFPYQQEQYNVKENVGNLDIFPTILGCLDIKIQHQGQLDGQNLVKILSNHKEEYYQLQNRPVFSYREPPGDESGWEVSVILKNEKLVLTEEDAFLYDLSTDPDETLNIADSMPGRVEFLKRFLDMQEY